MKPEELIAWLNGRGADKPCPACDANDWLGETDVDDGTLAVVSPIGTKLYKAEDGNSYNELIKYNAFMVSCKNCGFIRLHNKKIVEGEANG